MTEKSQVATPGPKPGTVRLADGSVVRIPAGWVNLPPGDATLTRRVKAAGPSITVQEKKGRRAFSKGVWAAAEQIKEQRTKLEAERGTEAYAKRRASDVKRREKKQSEYVGTFDATVRAFLDFDPRYEALEAKLAAAVTAHATPVGSGTVARTQRIPVERRAESAVIAWLRHQTTAYDNMTIQRKKGRRRQVRRMLAEQSRRLLETYRRGRPADAATCPLQVALADAKEQE